MSTQEYIFKSESYMGKQNYARSRKDVQICIRKTQTILIIKEGKILYNNRISQIFTSQASLRALSVMVAPPEQFRLPSASVNVLLDV